MPNRLALYADALTAVRASQVAGRARRLLPARLLASGPPTASGWRPLAAGLGVDPAPPSGPLPGPEADGVFRFVGVERSFARPAFWTDDRDGLLFLFGLHGFSQLASAAADGLSPRGRRFWIDVVDDWLAKCSRPGGAAWHPFPLSERLIAWCAALSVGGWSTSLASAMRASAARQLLFLRRSVEHDIGGNHVLRNATALVVAGACLEDAPALDAGRRLLDREVARQVLSDGGHEERSPSYHRMVLADLRAAATVLERAAVAQPGWVTRLDAMQHWLQAIAAPDGTLPLFNDAWAGPAVTPAGDGVHQLDGTGHVIARCAGEQLWVDCGELGPRHLPAHAHADALSVELWADGSPVIADPGAFTYSGPERDAFRGTTAHATVEVDGVDQCRFWGPFRASLLPSVRRTALEQRPDGWLVVRAEHDGYRPVVHERTVAWHPEAGLVLADRLHNARGPHAVVSTLPLHPEARLDRGHLGSLRVSALDGGPFDQRPARYAPFLAVDQPTTALELRRTLAPGTPTGWVLLREGHALPRDLP